MALYQLDTENADRNITSSIAVLTHTPTVNAMCIGLIKLGDGTKNLSATGGFFELVITVGGQTVQPSPQVINFSTAVRAAVWITPFPVPANSEVIMSVKSPNAADSDVDCTAFLYDMTFALPGAAYDAAGGLPISDAGGLDIDTLLGILSNGTYGNSAIKTLIDALSGATGVSISKILNTALTETSAGYLAAAFKKFLDVATPVFTAACVNQAADSNVILASGTYGLSALKTLIDALSGATGVSLSKILNTAIPAESVAGRDAAAFGKLFDVATPVLTAACVNQGADSNTILTSLNTEMAKIPKSDSTVTFNATALASIKTQATTALSDINLDHLLKTPVSDASKLGSAGGNEVVDSTIGALLLSDNGNADGFNYTTDSQEAISDKVTAVDDYVDTEIGTLTTELAKVPKSDSTVTWNPTALASINAEVDTALNTAIPATNTADSVNDILLDQVKARIPTSGTIAKAGDQMDLVNAPNATAVTAIQNGLATPTNITAGTITTVTNLTNLPAAAATAAALTTVDGIVDDIKAVTTKLDTALEADSAVYRFTTNALEQAPGGSAPTAAQIRAEIDSNSTQLAAIVEDTGTTLPATLTTIIGYINSEIADILEDTGTTLPATLTTIAGYIDTEIATLVSELAKVPKSDSNVSWNATALAAINAQVVDCLNVDTYAEPGQGTPAATNTLVAKIGYLFKAWRNLLTTSATEIKLYNDAGDTVDQKATISDSGTLFSKGEIGTGA